MPWQIQIYMQLIYLSSVTVGHVLERQNEQEVQSQLVGYQWSVTQTKTSSLEKDEANSLFHCLIQECDHDGFQSQRGCRKHVNMLSGVALPTHIRVGLESPSRGSLGIILQTGY